MKFTSPAFLFALLAIAIPILIHLFNFRKFKRIYFSNVRFLKEVKQETQSRSRLKHLLVLLARILTIIFLVLAFAGPYIPADNKKKIQTGIISLYIDNSFSMEASGKSGSLLDEAKKTATEIVNSYKGTQLYQLLTNDFEPKHQRLAGKEEMITMIADLKITPVTRTTTEIFSRHRELLQSTGKSHSTLFYLSDIQRSGFEAKALKKDTLTNLLFIPVNAVESKNIFIDSCWFDSPVRQAGYSDQLKVRVRNTGDQVAENVPVKLFINGQQKSLSSLTLDPNSYSDTSLTFTPSDTGINNCRIEITDYPVVFDDQFYFSFSIEPSIPVLSINAQEGNNFLKVLYGKDSYFVFEEVSEKNIDYSSFARFRLILLNQLDNIPSGLGQELKKFIEKGGNVVVFPGAKMELASYEDFLTAVEAPSYLSLDTARTKVEIIEYQHQLFRNVFEKKPDNIDLPAVLKHYRINRNTRLHEERLMVYRNGDTFLGRYGFGKGQLYLYSVPLDPDFSNLARHAVFVPVMYNIALFSVPSSPLYFTIGKNVPLEVPVKLSGGDEVFHLVNKEKEFDAIPAHKLDGPYPVVFFQDQVKEAGSYFLTLNKIPAQGIAFNYDRKESDLKYFSRDELEEELKSNGITNASVLKISEKPVAQIAAEQAEGKKLWKLCLILALLFIAAEIALIKLWK